MPVLLIALRPYTDDNNTLQLTDRYTNIHIKDHKTLFKDVEKVLEAIPKEKRYNLYFSAYYALPEAPRKGISQDTITFDIDHINLEHIDRYIEPILTTLGIQRSKTVIIATGNGLQFLIQVKDSWKQASYFKDNRGHYKWWCDKIEKSLKDETLEGDVDSSVFSPSRLLRLPFTQNRKPMVDPFGSDVNIKQATLIQGDLAPQPFNLTDTPFEAKGSSNVLPTGTYGKPDVESILEGCNFLKWIKESPDEIHEPQVYAMLSITALFPDEQKTTRELFGKLSSPSIDAMDLDIKIEQAKTASGPRTCENIATLWSGCGDCENFGKCKSPIQIKGPNFIATADQGFTMIDFTSTGAIKYIRCFEDLMLFYYKEFKYINLGEVERIMNYTGTHFVPTNATAVKCYAQNHFKPKLQKEQEAMEFLNLINRNHYTDMDFITDKKTVGKLNLHNGVLDLATAELVDHDPKFGFRHVLPYDYDRSSTVCPVWDRFMDMITCSRPELQNILEEYIAYVLSNQEYIFQKILILSGSGANGKSTLINIIRLLCGEGNYCSVPITSISRDQFALAQLDSKLVNFSEEEPVSCFSETGNLKRITGNTPVNGRHPYEKAFEFTNKAKIIISYNKIPYLSDTSEGMLRRLMIVPFNYDLLKNEDKLIKDLMPKIRKELPAILNRMIIAYSRLMKARKFTRSQECDYALESMVRDSDAFQEWCAEFVTVTHDDNDRHSLQTAYDFYLADMEKGKNEKVLGYRGFIRKLKDFATKHGLQIKKAKVNSKVTRAICGMTISSDSLDINMSADY